MKTCYAFYHVPYIHRRYFTKTNAYSQ